MYTVKYHHPNTGEVLSEKGEDLAPGEVAIFYFDPKRGQQELHFPSGAVNYVVYRRKNKTKIVALAEPLKGVAHEESISEI